MMKWDYLVGNMEAGMLTIKWADGTSGKQSLQGGLDYLGSQGWELVAVMQQQILGSTTQKAELIFKKSKG